MANSEINYCWPEINKIQRKISKEFKLAFTSAYLIGLIVHLYVFSNLLLGNDATNNTFSSNSHLSSGRWALGLFSSFSGIYQMPVVIGVISITMLALTAGLTVRILELSQPVSIVLTSALLVSYPPVACTFAYMFTADAYFIALFINAAAVYVAKKYRFGWVVTIFLIATACGIYQAYICYAIGLFLFDCILALLSQESVKAVLLRGGKYILLLAMGLLLYSLIQKTLMSYYDVSLGTYMGMDTIGNLDIKARLAAIPRAYKTLGSYFLNWPYITPSWRLFHWGAFLLGGLSLVWILIAKKLYQNPIRMVLIIIGCLMMPLALDFVVVLAYSTSSVHLLMIYSFILSYVFLIKCTELAAQQMTPVYNKYGLLIFVVSSLCSIMIVWNNFCLSNIGYHSLQLCYENSFALANRIAVQVEMLDGYSAGDPIAIVGYPSTDFYGNSNRYKNYRTAPGWQMNLNLIVYKSFFNDYIGLHIPALSSEQYAELENSETIASMPVYPAKGSVAMVNGIAVVKLGEGGVQ